MDTVEVLEFNDWSQLIAAYRLNFPPEHQWIFRGHANAEWHLETTLERAIRMYKIPHEQTPGVEMQILREFLRKIKNYQESFRSNDALECLSFIQHFGGPTRLLDWTYSFYVAAFFALSSAIPDSRAAIWCFKSTVWDEYETKKVFFTEAGEKEIASNLLFRGDRINAFFNLPRITENNTTVFQKFNSHPCVHQLNSHFMNPRIERQQGIFLVQTDLSHTFEENVEIMLREPHFVGSVKEIIISCTREFIKEALIDLRRMNITYESLFGDVNYFCKSLTLGMINLFDLQTDSNGTQYLRKEEV